MAKFFNKITSDFPPLPKRVEPLNNNSTYEPLELYQVAARIKKFKKTRSMIKGDIFPDLVSEYADLLAIPLTEIYNFSLMKKQWPSTWKEETMIIIPKCANPSSYSELRNLSCTPLFSKILESFVLERLKKEITTDLTQFGNTKNCGTEHYLISAWNYILEALDSSSVCNLISIDFSKAFNSLIHGKCLEMFRKRGASQHSVDMIYGFLEDRKMSVKIEGIMSDSLSINGGSPQGTLLGNLIFIVATSELDKDLVYEEQPAAEPTAAHAELVNEESREDSSSSDNDSLCHFQRSRLNTIYESSDEEELNRSINQHLAIQTEFTPEDWISGTPLVAKYVDDILGCEKLFAPAGKTHSTTTRQLCSIYARRSEELIEQITEKAQALGLRVNGDKTQMVCVSSSVTMDINTFIKNSKSNSKVLSGPEMKILGFFFGSIPMVELHLSTLQSKFRKRLWLLRNLKHARATKKDLVGAFCCFIRPVLEYCSNVYHPMINQSQSLTLEKMQFTALKIIFGYDKSHTELLELSGLPCLSERRNQLCNSFCLKIYNNERFRNEWIEERLFVGPNLRHQKIIVEKQAKTNRLYNSPIYKIRRTLNDILVK